MQAEQIGSSIKSRCLFRRLGVFVLLHHYEPFFLARPHISIMHPDSACSSSASSSDREQQVCLLEAGHDLYEVCTWCGLSCQTN